MNEASFCWLTPGSNRQGGGHLSGGEVESQFLSLELPLLLSNGHRQKWLFVFAYSVFSGGVFCFYTIMTSDNFEQAWSNVSLTRAR